MSKRHTASEIEDNKERVNPRLRSEVLGIFLLAAGIISIISLLDFNTGSIGLYLSKFLKYSFGLGAFIIPLLLIIIGGFYIKKDHGIVYSIRFWGLALLYISLLALTHHFLIIENREILPESLANGGGLIGGMLLFILRKFFGFYGAFIILVASGLCGILIATTWSLYQTYLVAKERTQQGLSTAYEQIEKAGSFYNQEKDRNFLRKNNKEEIKEQDEDSREFTGRPLSDSLLEQAAYQEAEEINDKIRKDEPIQRARENVAEVKHKPNNKGKIEENHSILEPESTFVSGYVLPPLSILQKSTNQADSKRAKEVANNAKILESTLESFNVKAKMIHISQGPTVTRYELEPAPGVKVSKIVNLADDIALSLAASGVRIEAPIPGKAAIGIEVPNKVLASVPLRDVLESNEFLKATSKLIVALGKDIAGQTVTADLGKMPHLLVAGSTGSGKSVCINTLLTSILFKATPQEVRLILIDPKVVELTNYNGLPHLLTPVVTDAQKAASALRWAVQEMERRYEMFAAAGVRDIGRYNELIDNFPVGEGSSGEKIPYILIIIDELADLMMVSPVDVEDAIIRLAQKARAAGIHMVLATQRPSVDVITGLIKANVPSRIAFAVSSQIDSRTILDMAGAEKLLGKGDMLFYPIGMSKPLRVQGAFIADSEVEELTEYIKKQVEPPEYMEGITACENLKKEENDTNLFEDELFEDAVRIIMELNQASASMLQRKFRIGYTRASRLIDTMEEMKIIGPNMGSKPRDIIMTYDQVCDRYFNDAAQSNNTDLE
ncbi:FtsK/SpoIIIE family DNA translocase [Pelosinus propionicus]|uniref:DNA segregation ATPase FtsK/SpoIIIE, S-DNA-T family n=1 Tax=Pelosinus propionicus DSM 13327 TaxID=1123291 RepID=A0A1I4KY80_9FIRM|nr:DNA translocase FtsK [Pelosinus propionicus]SFL83764.1 DNA segregation ATPase FtsK/SpoIIIE, S-DNA-T family [Pelosinus propionicus DSM 13327]